MLGGMQGMAAGFQWGSEPAKQVAMLGSVATIDVGAAFWPPVASREWKASFCGWERGFFALLLQLWGAGVSQKRNRHGQSHWHAGSWQPSLCH